MTLSFLRVLFVLTCSVVGYYIGDLVGQPILGPKIGCLVGLVVIFMERQLQQVSVSGLSSMVFGLLLGVFMAKLLIRIMNLLPLDDFILSVSELVITLIFSYLGAVMALRGKDEFNIIIPYIRFKRQNLHEDMILVDTSAIIDGRVADIYLTGFLAGRLVVPRSVLLELQALADSKNDVKRERGRRGLELLRVMQSNSKIEIRIHEDNLHDKLGVDHKLIELAKLMDASICTTDFNLGRVAELQDVEVLNVHELSKAVKSVVYAGEKLNIKLIKEGKDSHQAVGYLDDGTMIVVGQARDFIGKQMDVMVTSVLQTQAGKMVFAKIES